MTCIDEIRDYLDTLELNTTYFNAQLRRYSGIPWWGPSYDSDYVRFTLNRLWQTL